MLEDPTIAEMAERVRQDRRPRSRCAGTCSWGDIVFPKSATRSRVRENFEMFDFELERRRHGPITALNKDERTGPNPDEFNRIPGK